MRIRVLLFASLRERAGTGEVRLEVPEGASVGAARAALEERFPGLLRESRAAVAVNGTYVRGDEGALRDEDEVAFLPPVSGG